MPATLMARCFPPMHCSPSAFRQAARPRCRRQSARTASWIIRSIRWTRRPCGLRSPDRSTASTFRGWPSEFKRALPTYQPPAPNYDWTGFYIGAFVDGSWLKSSSSAVNGATGAPFPATGGNSSQWGGGVQLGFDYMLPSRCRSRRCSRYVVRRHQDSDGLGCLRHKRKPDNRL